MADLRLFPREHIAGVFRGFQQGGLEFHADLVLPYRHDFQSIPMHGQFVLVQLETPDEAVLGRIASFSSEGKLSFGSGEEFNIRAVRESRPVPEDLREQYLKYRVNIRVLGVLRVNGKGLTFVPSHRRLPHVGSPVAFPSPEVLREVAGHNVEGASIGHLAFGEYVYAGDSTQFDRRDWMQVLAPETEIRFPVDSLVSRRSFIFARAGFGKSNLNKLLFSRLYRETPTVLKRGGKRVPVGTVIFDPDGEYFWPDDKGRPGLCDVPELADKLVVFTSRANPSPYYQSFVAGGTRLDIRRFRPADVIAIAIGPERQDQQNVRKLRGLSQDRWEELVNLIDADAHTASLEEVCRLLDLDPGKQEAEALAARANMTQVVKMLHDKSSQLMDMLIHALSEGKLCVIDVSQMRGGQALVLSGLILRRIFDRNQIEFTSANPKTIPTIAVVEEAQSVLNEKASASEPYIAWVKEGRKYDLGVVLVTQQPGSVPTEILSQGDNWFIFHLLSSADLMSLKKANSHFSDDLLSSLLNEPIQGQGLFWSSVAGKPYPVSVRVHSFERMYSMCDPSYSRPAAQTYAVQLKNLLRGHPSPEKNSPDEPPVVAPERSDVTDDESPRDLFAEIEDRAINALRSDEKTMERIKSETGAAWGSLKAFFLEKLPVHLDDRETVAYRLVPKAMDRIFGPQNESWESYKHPQRKTMYVRLAR
jgi:hypothetical protein